MPLNNIHEWADDEVITHDDLNSIGEAVSQSTSSGAIIPTQLVWPLVAQGDIDMNSYTIRNLNALSGVIHVNDEKTLAQAVSEIVSGGTIIIDPGAATVANATDVLLTGKSDITIMGYGSTEIAVGGSVTTAGIQVANSCHRIKITGIKFTGGTTGKPAVLLDGGSDTTVVGCSFNTPVGLAIGSVSNVVYTVGVERNNFNGCAVGLALYNITLGNITENKFISCTRGIKLPGDSEGSLFSRNTFKHNKFSDVLADSAIYGLWTGTVNGDRGNNVFEGNVFATHASNKAFDVSGYYRNKYIANECGCPVSIKGTEQRIIGNTFEKAVVIDGLKTHYDSNETLDAFSITTAAQAAVLTNNRFWLNIALDSKVLWYNGNVFYVAPTVTSGDTYTDEENYGGTPVTP